jgi:hypothetical protein
LLQAFQITTKKERDATMVVNGYQKQDKITLVGWVDKTIDQSLIKDNMRLGFRVTNIWPLNPKVMNERTQLSKIYIETIILVGEHLGEDGYISGDQNDHV